MKLITFSGPPSSGKTSVILKLARLFEETFRLGVVKFDCLTSHDQALYEQAHIPVQTGISGTLCPDHFFASNIGACMQWALRQNLNLLISESAGLCNRCSPHLRNAAAVCVIDILSGIDAPQKIGPMLKLADFVIITKSDLVSQAEREVFALHTIRANPRAQIFFINGLTGQGVFAFTHVLAKTLEKQTEDVSRLRFSMPGAVCSYCFGETQIGEKYATGNIKYMHISDQVPQTTRPSRNAPLTQDIPKVSRTKQPIPLTKVLETPFDRLVASYPLCINFFEEIGIIQPAPNQSVQQLIDTFDEFDLSDCGMSATALAESFCAYITRMELISQTSTKTVHEITLCGGQNKVGETEDFNLTVHAGETVCIVGPTGSGKSRLLEDIEYLAQGDTPTKRRIFVDGKEPPLNIRHAIESKIVAQLSQSMVFVMDLPVSEFLRLHAESKMMPADLIEHTVDATIACAHELCGETFSPDTSLTVLSGGQSRALMIADLAFISTAPIVLIDEIENAGVDRRRALDLLTSSEKIVFAVTHDPLIALMGDKRLIIEGGGVQSVITPHQQERDNARMLQTLDEKLMELRHKVRQGERIDFDTKHYFDL